MKSVTKITSLLACALLLASATALAQDKGYQVRYRGGSISSTTSGNLWAHTLTVSKERILLVMNDGTRLELTPAQITKIAEGKTKNLDKKSGLLGIGAIIVRPDTQRYFEAHYKGPDGTPGQILLQVQTDDYKALKKTLEGFTGKKLERLDMGKDARKKRGF